MTEQEFIQYLYYKNTKCSLSFPDRELATDFIDELFEFLFLPKIKKPTSIEFQKQFDGLKNHFLTLVYAVLGDSQQADKNSALFFNALPNLYQQLMKDAEAIVRFDPAAQSVEEVLLAYPGFYATAVYRISHQLYQQKIKILPRLFTEYAHSKTGIDIHPAATIGDSFFIDHGTGIVIGETTIIGNNVKIYQSVTLGALNVAKELAKTKRHPTIEDNVIIYSGATILGGDTVIGHDSVIGGNVWLTNSVLPYSVVYHRSEIAVKDKFPSNEPILNFVI